MRYIEYFFSDEYREAAEYHMQKTFEEWKNNIKS